MIRTISTLFFICFALPSFGQAQLPALYDVHGVTVGDVLNIRAEPKASAELIGTIARDAKGVEVVAMNPDSTWATVNTDEGTGYVAVKFLAVQAGPDWGALKRTLHCIGTEPFWSLDLDPAKGTATQTDPDGVTRTADIFAVWPNAVYRAAAAVAFDSKDIDGLATLRGERCSDGMSDRSYGVAIDMFLRDDAGAASGAFSGCCSLLP